VGVLGGMGPAATVDFLRKIVVATPAETDQEHVPVILHGIPQIPDRSSAIEQGSDAPFFPMLAGLKMLERSGADIIAIPCNTAHHWYDRLARNTPVRIVHIVDAVRDEIQSLNLSGPVAILASRGLLASGLYQSRLKETVRDLIIPEERIQQMIDTAIAAIKSNDEKASQGASAKAAEALVDMHAEVLVLACTELPIAFRNLDLAVHLIDPTAILARACVAASIGQAYVTFGG
jgi:aspartate racemase